MKKQVYIRDVLDSLGENDTSKNVLSIAKKIKSSQKKAFPSIEYKQHLGDNLSNIHELQLQDNVKSQFSLLQIFSAFATFIFVIMAWVFFTQMQSVSEIDTMQIQNEFKTQNRGVSESIITPSDSIQSKAFESSLSDIQEWDYEIMQQEWVAISLWELCELYGANYDEFLNECGFINGTTCRNYDEQSISECALYDASILEENNPN